MPAYFIAIANIKDQTKYQEYGAKAGPTLGAHGGTILARGAFSEALVGTKPGEIMLVAEFPNADAIRTWYNSPEYQEAIPIREQALEANFMILEPPPS